MDDTPKYILMCEKAKEVQKQLPLFSERIHSFFWADNKIGGWIEVVNTKTKKYIWLPRQDQLQKIIIEKKNSLTNKKLEKNIAISRLQCWFSQGTSMNWEENWYYWQFDSMEQLWLGFVMSKKYGKIWDGKDWMKE